MSDRASVEVDVKIVGFDQVCDITTIPGDQPGVFSTAVAAGGHRGGSRYTKPRNALGDHNGVVTDPSGFVYTTRKNGDVVITHHGRTATTLRGSDARKFLDRVATDPQRLMARVTGNYKRGNERRATDPDV